MAGADLNVINNATDLLDMGDIEFEQINPGKC